MHRKRLVPAAATFAALALIAVGGLVGRAPAEQVAAQPSDAGAFAVDSVHSSVVFKIGHLGVSNFYGRFNAPTGTFSLDLANPSASTIDVSAETEKVDTGNQKRDNHLRSSDFFNAKQFPSITFKSTSFEEAGPHGLNVTGKLTLNGVTKTVTVPVTLIGESETPQGHKQGIEAEFTIKRSDYGMTTYLENNALGDEVRLFVALEGVRR